MKTNETEFWPLHTLRDNDLEAAIWELKDLSGGSTFSVRVSRIYHADREPKYSNLFSKDDLLRLSKIALAANSWIAIYEKKG